MTISKVAYVQVPSINKLISFLNKNGIDWSNHRDGCDEEEFWVEIQECTIDVLKEEFLNEQESQQCIDENVENIIFYE